MKRLVSVLLVALLLTAMAATVWAKEYKGMIFDDSAPVREINLTVEGDQVKVIFGKALSYPNMTMKEETLWKEKVEDPRRFILNPKEILAGGYEFIYQEEKDEYLVKIQLGRQTTGKSGRSFAEGTLSHSKK